MFWTIHNTQSGNLIDITHDLPDAQPTEYTVKAWDMEVPDLYFYQWNNQTLQFIPKLNVERNIAVYRFLMRFTAQERIAIKEAAKSNAALSDYMDIVKALPYVNLDDQETFGGLYFLALNGLILQNRISEILN